ncbi:putative MFS family arabinose efflux permease [Natronospira proteinivora]|uniref:MFS family arabinose efflux permease n=1 Tax=Natronospira proteinivora TaxID=1807133 RepID=A0ABT1G9C0_9GAMM|nr:putative MFS family arabinose efflux permease [Natronospira proteinivora]
MNTSNQQPTPEQANWRAVGALSGVFALRMLGIFMVFPVLAIWAEDLPDATPALIGLALGVYGVTQAFFQIPMGALSDRIGRRRVIVVGLIIFALGSLLAASADTIWGVIAGRALQGAGAIAAAITALVADVTPPHLRTRSMAIIGASIGGAFGLSMVLGPLLEGVIGVPGIFLLTAVLSVAAIAWLLLTVPNLPVKPKAEGTGLGLALFREPGFAGLTIGIFVLHLVLTAAFVILPGLLRDSTGLGVSQHWQIYLPVLLAAVAGMVPMVLKAERGTRAHGMVLLALAQVAVGLALMAFTIQTAWGVVAGLWVFFIGFTFMEAHLPARVSQVVPEAQRGTALGLYSSAQFLGAFVGGAGGGLLLGFTSLPVTLGSAAALVALWLAFMATTCRPRD